MSNKQDVTYKLPTDIESRFDKDYTYGVKGQREWKCLPHNVKQFIATEQVTLLEWMLRLTEFQVKVDENGKKWIDAEYLKSKIQTLLQEYTI